MFPRAWMLAFQRTHFTIRKNIGPSLMSSNQVEGFCGVKDSFHVFRGWSHDICWEVSRVLGDRKFVARLLRLFDIRLAPSIDAAQGKESTLLGVFVESATQRIV